jgi:hypothetical protein
MRQHDGRWVCVECGARVAVPIGATPRVAIHVAAGQPTVRLLRIGAVEVHRCAVGPVVSTVVGHDD